MEFEHDKNANLHRNIGLAVGNGIGCELRALQVLLNNVAPDHVEEYCASAKCTTEQALTRMLRELYELAPNFIEHRPPLDGYGYFDKLTPEIVAELRAEVESAEAATNEQVFWNNRL